MQNSDDKPEDLNVYRIGRLTLLELLTFLAVLGILLTWVVYKFW